MEKENNNKGKNIVIILLLIITIALLALLVLVTTGKIDLNKIVGNSNENKVEEKNDNNEISNVDDDELTNETSTNDIDEQSRTENTANWNIAEAAKKYITLEDVKLTDEVTTKKVKFNNLSDNLTSQFYNDQQAVIDNIHIYNDEHIKGGAEYKVKAFVNDNILSVIYLLEEKNAVGICGTKMAVTNIDLVNKIVITEEELLSKAGTSYKQIVTNEYNDEVEFWKEYTGVENSYYDITFSDFVDNKTQYIDKGLNKIEDVVYTYIEDGKIKYDYYSINMSTLFHPVGKGGCFIWRTVTLGDYK